MQHPVGHVQRNRRQLQHLRRVVRPRQGKRRVATRTPLGPQLLDYRGGQEHLAMARMARCTTRFARRGGGRTLARLLVGRVRRRWPMGGGRILVETGLQCGDTLLEGMELREVFLHRTQIRLDCGGRVLPVLG